MTLVVLQNGKPAEIPTSLRAALARESNLLTGTAGVPPASS